jgi:DNA-dependent RNA polymerase auxiliary subunit epsilon
VEKITEKKNTMDIFEQVAEMKVEEKSWLVVSNLLTDTAFSVEKIASLADVSIDFVKEVKKSIKKK